ncbi:hypothetical protein [Legionella fallonii]|uniref:Uncharacterized protein n=1 Tax=Legionella fallonii LLAP-10 TaxID=1212491 RepID=A0A098FZB2_9GAMM|nr:hypothetical protein [Legionella fallonii]CEG55557.1 membrane protein of unknown function [Legionella fallonii LLAP-10]
MLTQLRKYITHVSANLMSFSSALVQSTSSLLPDGVTTIAKSLFHISVTDFLPAALAFSLNRHLQDGLSQYEDDLPEEAIVYRNGVMLTAAAVNVLFLSFITSRAIRGGIRTAGLTATTPLLLNQGSLDDDIPRARLYDLGAFHSSFNRALQGLEFIGGIIVNEGVDLFLPEDYITKFFCKIWVGYEIVDGAMSRNDLMRLSTLRINSLPLLVGSSYFLSSYMKDHVLDGNTNPYFNLLIDNCIFVGLFAVVANLKLRNVPLQSEPGFFNALQDWRASYSIELLRSLSRKLKNLEHYDLSGFNALESMYTNVAKATLLPTMLHSPKQFFDDKVISELLDGLSPQAVSYLQDKYSTKQIETFLGHLEILMTRKLIPRHTQSLCRFFAINTWSDAFQSKLLSVRRVNPMPDSDDEEIESDDDFSPNHFR